MVTLLTIAQIKESSTRLVKNHDMLYMPSNLGDLKEVVVHIQRDIKTVGDSMSIKMQYLQSTANDIANVVGKSLENHMQLLDGQSKAMVSLINL
jgi:prefoldin subunit 5